MCSLGLSGHVAVFLVNVAVLVAVKIPAPGGWCQAETEEKLQTEKDAGPVWGWRPVVCAVLVPVWRVLYAFFSSCRGGWMASQTFEAARRVASWLVCV